MSVQVIDMGDEEVVHPGYIVGIADGVLIIGSRHSSDLGYDAKHVYAKGQWAEAHEV